VVVLIFLALFMSSPLLYQLVKRVLRGRHDKWRAEAWHVCVRVAELHTALGRLVQLVPKRLAGATRVGTRENA
jgi:hypothetical protein